MLILSIIVGISLVFAIGYYLGHQIGGTAHIRSQLSNSSSEQLTSHHQI